MGLTSEKTLDRIQALFDKMFDINSLLDRQVYLLDINWNMPKYSNFLHHKISHEFPLYADKIQEFGSLRGDLFFRGVVPAHRENYDSVASLTEDFVMAVADAEKLCQECIYSAIDNKDLMYEDFIRSFQVDVIAPMVKQSVVFYNAIKEYEKNNDIRKWNKDFDDWIIPHFEEEDD